MTRIASVSDDLPPPTGPVYLDAELVPNQSLTRRGFKIVMLAMAAASFVAGCVFLVIGAWPVIGFFGLDILLLWLAFRISFRGAARERETVRVTAERIDVAHRDRKGLVRRWMASPFFARVEVTEAENSHPVVALRSGPDSLPLGTCLAPDDRRSFASALEAAIVRARQERHPVPA